MAKQIVPQGWLQLPLRATSPYPAHMATGTPQTLLLRWAAGDRAASHDLYFGDNKDAVEGGIAPTARLGSGELTYNPGALEWGKTYYWRVDEVNAAVAESPWKGVTWSFTTAAFLVVDDFEVYTDTVGERVFQTWLDSIGYTDPKVVPGNGSGSTVGNADEPFAELKTVHSGYQAMPMAYSNAESPYYSQADRTWTTPQNWATNGVNTLVLYVHGSPGNEACPLYAVLEDSTGNTGTVNREDAAAVTSNTWLEWKILLSRFSKVSPAKIKRMSIGVGTPGSVTPGGSGTIFVDDIRVVKP